ncbi:hypothetical protein IEQ34_003539 [Dendrobium chrysotoxum]|uniref:Uncharacterized protein n=1 Tax=Dendrobium chrysotoxum TaxID=161865 RepID=A0AAV7HHX5_DENCH|nr:hypothetical protein IEQ34_003539 [Dendrobium chrysotoxum]
MSAELRFSALIFKLSLKVISMASLVHPVYFLLYAFWGYSFPALPVNSLHPRIKKVNHFQVFHLAYRLQLPFNVVWVVYFVLIGNSRGVDNFWVHKDDERILVL